MVWPVMVRIHLAELRHLGDRSAVLPSGWRAERSCSGCSGLNLRELGRVGLLYNVSIVAPL